MKITEFGDPILRQVARRVTADDDVDVLIAQMRAILLEKELGIGLAAPQVGKNLALSVIAVRASEHRPKVKSFDLVIINPEIVEVAGRRTQLYEGCISGGPGTASLFAKVPRYKRVRLRYTTQNREEKEEWFDGLVAHVIQHEVDHLNGILFVDKVKDTKSYMTHGEYLKYAARMV